MSTIRELAEESENFEDFFAAAMWDDDTKYLNNDLNWFKSMYRRYHEPEYQAGVNVTFDEVQVGDRVRVDIERVRPEGPITNSCATYFGSVVKVEKDFFQVESMRLLTGRMGTYTFFRESFDNSDPEVKGKIKLTADREEKKVIELKDLRVGDEVCLARTQFGVRWTVEGKINVVEGDKGIWLGGTSFFPTSQNWVVESLKRPEDPRIQTVIDAIAGGLGTGRSYSKLAQDILDALDKEKS